MLLALLMILQAAPVGVIAEGIAVISNVVQGETFYQVTFVSDGATVATQYVRSGNSLTLPETPHKEGYHFVGWTCDGAGVSEGAAVNSDMTITAEFHYIAHYTFTVSYVDEAGNEVAMGVIQSWSEDDDLPVNADGVKYVTIESPPTVVRDDYNIYPDQYSVTFLLQGEQTQHANVVYSAATTSYTVEHYVMSKVVGADGSVTFTRNNATLLSDYTQSFPGRAGSFVTPESVAIEGYIYSESVPCKLSADASLNVAKVYYRPVARTLTYNTADGSYVAAVNGHVGDTVPLTSEVPTRVGYTFNGWYMDEAATEAAPSSITLNGNVTVYAGWTPETVNYTVVTMRQVYNNATSSKEYVYHASTTMSGTVGTMTNVTTTTSPSIYHTYAETDNAVIAADGSTVVTVYYDLTEYTIIFDVGSDGTITMNGREYHGTGYQLKVVLGQNISSVWPTPDKVTHSNGYNLDTWRGKYKTTRFEVTTDMLPTKGTTITYTADWFKTSNEKIVRYWLQNTDGNGYTISTDYSQVFIPSSRDGLDPKSIYGFTNVKEEGGDQSNFTFNGKTYDSVYVYDFYYDRSQYAIDYRYRDRSLSSIGDVYFGADITGDKYNWTPDPTAVGLPSEYTFAGWYDNADCQGTPYNFTVMPGNNLILYAKFNPPTRILDLMTDSAQNGVYFLVDSETVIYGTTAAPADPVQEGYRFLGWYSEPTGGVLYDPRMPLTENVTYYARWERVILSYTVEYIDEQGNTVAPSKVVTDPAFIVGDVVTETPVLVGDHRCQVTEKSFTLTGNNDSNVITFVYALRAGTAYTVHYYIEGTTTPIINSITVEVNSLNERVTQFAPANVPYNGQVWYPTVAVKALTLAADPNANIIPLPILMLLPTPRADITPSSPSTRRTSPSIAPWAERR